MWDYKLSDDQLLMAAVCCTADGHPDCTECPLVKDGDCIQTFMVEARNRLNMRMVIGLTVYPDLAGLWPVCMAHKELFPDLPKEGDA